MHKFCPHSSTCIQNFGYNLYIPYRNFGQMSSQRIEIIQKDRKRLQNPYAHLNGEGKFEALIHSTDSAIDPSKLFGQIPRGIRLTDAQLESIAQNLLDKLWLHRFEHFPEQDILRPLDVRKPDVALMSLGFQVNHVAELQGYYSKGKYIETAGIIDRSEMAVWISRRFPPAVCNFTTAHELGHAVLHEAVSQHRDRPRDGALDRSMRDPIEREAEKFAKYFLMPKNLVLEEFKQRFRTRRFVLNETTAFALNVGDTDVIRRLRNSKRALSRFLAVATQFNQKGIYSLTEVFQVSKEAMAIRLEELNLI